MDEQSWWATDSDVPKDEDTVSFEPRFLSRLRRARHRPPVGWMLLVAFLIGSAVGAGVTLQVHGSGTPNANHPPSTVVTGPVVAPPKTDPVGPQAEPVNPQSTYTVSCWAELSPSPPAAVPYGTFSGLVTFVNSGNVGLAYQASVTWFVPHSTDVTRTIRRQVPPHESVHARLHALASPSEAAANQALGRHGIPCTVRVTLLSTFGSSYR